MDYQRKFIKALSQEKELTYRKIMQTQRSPQILQLGNRIGAKFTQAYNNKNYCLNLKEKNNKLLSILCRNENAKKLDRNFSQSYNNQGNLLNQGFSIKNQLNLQQIMDHLRFNGNAIECFDESIILISNNLSGLNNKISNNILDLKLKTIENNQAKIKNKELIILMY